MPARRDATDIANELYARCFASSRIAALNMVLKDPGMVTELLLMKDGPEMRGPDERALRSDNWGPCG